MNDKLQDVRAEVAKILLVDDKQANLLALEALLTGRNREFFWAASGEEALGLAYRHEFALMMIDVQMPGMNGFELASILKSNKRTSKTPIVYVTAHRFDQEDVLQGYTEGAVDYLFKPLNPNVTRAKVDAFLEMYYQRKYIERMNMELDRNNKELKLSNTALEEFASVVAHDLKEPLRTISSFLQLLHLQNENTLDESSLEFIKICQDGAARLDNLVNSLRQYARIGYQDMASEDMELDDVLLVVKNGLMKKIKDRNATLEVEGPLPKVHGNKIQIRQLFQNLIDNAIKYQPEGNKPRIHISSQRHREGWRISVKDNGIGIKDQYAEKIFGIFQRLHTDKEYPGTGVGLAVCKKIVDNHGGEISFHSKEGEGTTFFFTLPFARGSKD